MATSEAQKPSSSKSEFSGRYDIFLSFRGADTRKNFTDHLHNALIREGWEHAWKTFSDEEEIEVGEKIKSELQTAIQRSRMSLIVFSKDYVNSAACLFEVQTIVEHCKKSDHFILPVFFDVDPLEVKEQARDLEKFGLKGKKEIAMDKLKGWSAALMEVARMKGMVLQNQSDGYESKFMEEIVGELKIKLACKHMKVDDYLVSMHSRTKDVDLWLKDGSTGVGILVICGMGGIGKTTIAKVVYNSNHVRFDASCFLSNIREVAKGPKGILRLQRQLISDILRKTERKIYNVDDGCWRMRYVLANKRVLIVLDDVDEEEQLYALAGQRDWFFPGSKIIITTRLGNLIKADKSYEVYSPEKLSINDSLKLFSWHAFGQQHPTQEYMELSEMFVQHCDGLPLALQVLGSSVRRKSLDVWESVSQKLEDAILEKLKISFDSLQDDHDKNIFLEIACFFVGMKKNDTIAILDGCGYYALAGIHNLVDRNLLAIQDDRLQMHPLLQDMGKEIVCRESKYLEERSKIWCHEESFNILLEKKGAKKIKGLILDMDMLKEGKPGSINSNKVGFETNAFEKMCNLRLLKLNSVQLFGTYEAFPKRLVWLYWRGFSSESFPSGFPLENLVALDLCYSNLKQVWKGAKVLGSLKILNLSHSPKLSRTPDFSRTPNLEKLILKDCPSLVEFDESLVRLQRIYSLDLENCKNLRKLPRNIGMVESLEEMNISGCTNLMGAGEELEKMRSLRVLCVERMDINHLLSREVISRASIWP